MVAWAGLAAAGAGLASGLMGSSASSDAASAMKKTAKRQLKFAKKVFGRTEDVADAYVRDTTRAADPLRRDAEARALRTYNALTGQAGDLRRREMATIAGAYGDAEGDYRDAFGRARGDYTDAWRGASGELEAGRDAAIGMLRPSVGRGDNALAAYGYNLGLGPKPRDYTGPALSAGETFIRDQGMDAIRGAATSLNSGATLGDLMELGAGIGAQSRDRQQSELFALGGMGERARYGIADMHAGTGADLAALRYGYGRDMAGLSEGLGDRMAGLEMGRAAGVTAADRAYTGAMGVARNALTDRRYAADRDWMSDVTGARGARLNALVGAGSELGARGGGAIGAGGEASAAGRIGSANAWTDAINTGLGLYGYLNDGGFGGGAATRAPGMPMPRPRNWASYG